MSTLQNTAQDEHRTRTGALALGILIAIGLAVLIFIPTAHRTSATTVGGVAEPSSPAALTASAACFRDPGTHALTCSHVAPSTGAQAASTGYFRDPATHQLLGKPTRHTPRHRRPPHPPSGGVAP